MMNLLEGLLRLDFGSLIQRSGNFLLVLLFCGGIVSLRLDLQEMTLKQLEREQKLTRALGWLQISMAIAIFVVTRLIINFS